MTATITQRERALDPFRQHDDHLWIVFAGKQRWILEKRGDLLVTTSDDGIVIVDLSAVDWEAYNRAALAILREAFPDSSIAIDERRARGLRK